MNNSRCTGCDMEFGLDTPVDERKNPKALEKTVENYLKDKVKALGGLSFKFVSPSRRGAPDQLIQIEGDTLYVEVKTYKGELSELQKRFHFRLRRHGAAVFTVYGHSGVDDFAYKILAPKALASRRPHQCI